MTDPAGTESSSELNRPPPVSGGEDTGRPDEPPDGSSASSPAGRQEGSEGPLLDVNEISLGAAGDEDDEPAGDEELEPVPQRPLDPPKLVRLANLAREVLEEVRQMTPQESTVQDLAALYRRVEDQLKDALPEPLAEELDAMNLDLSFQDGVSQDEVRIALSGLIGWLGGLFQGLHASLLAAAPVLEAGSDMRPPGAMPPGQGPGRRPGLQPGHPFPAEDQKGEGYL